MVVGAVHYSQSSQRQVMRQGMFKDQEKFRQKQQEFAVQQKAVGGAGQPSEGGSGTNSS